MRSCFLSKTLILTLIYLLFQGNIHAQTKVEGSPVKWYTIEQADSLFAKNPKPIFIDVYTEWCGWCKKMMAVTFSNKGIANYLNTNFYPVRFDAETFDTISYQGKVYTNPGGSNKPKHNLAKLLLNGRYSFPTIVYIDRQRRINAVPGYMEPGDIEPLLVFFAEDVYMNAPYNEFETLYHFRFPKVFQKKIDEMKSEQKPDTSGVVNWLNPQQASEMSKKNGKPVYFHLYTDWCNACKVEEEVFKNPIIADLINTKFNPVNFNAASQETFNFFGKEYKGNGINNPHALTYALLKSSFKFPADIYITSEGNTYNEMHGFVLPYQLEGILNYLSEDKYKTVKFEDFIKTFQGKIKK